MSNGKDDFGDRIKTYEGLFTGYHVPFNNWLVVRVDGKNFSKYTKGFERPYDQRLASAMMETTRQLVTNLNANIGYTQSDEITLVFGKTDKQTEHVWGGKISKINSVVASMATAFFNQAITFPDDVEPRLAFFDARAFGVPHAGEASNAVLWRVHDARRNSISSLFRWTAGHAKMQNLNSREMIDVLRNEYGVSWEDQDANYRFGRFIKRVPGGLQYNSGLHFITMTYEEQLQYVTDLQLDVAKQEP